MRCLQIKIYPLNHTGAETKNEFSTLTSPVAWTAEYNNGAGTIKLLNSIKIWYQFKEKNVCFFFLIEI